ncbi:MAG: hypothetical protein EA402_05760, partial [Planctomycetota bacterium]
MPEVDLVIFTLTGSDFPWGKQGQWSQRARPPLVLTSHAQLQGLDRCLDPASTAPDLWGSVVHALWQAHQARQEQRRLSVERLTLQRRLAATESQLRDRQMELIGLETQAAMSQLVRSVAHELNNPLAVILGNAELLQRSLSEANSHGEKQVRRVQTIISEVESCQSIIQGLRKYARPQGEGAVAVHLS